MTSTLYDCRNAFADALLQLAASDDRIVATCNDSMGSSKLTAFAKTYPDRFFNMGIAEQNMVGVGAGLANAGKVPFVCSAGCFLTGRALEQIKADIAYSNRKVILCGMSSGVAYGPLGATHHAIEDLAWLRAIANMTVLVPADPEETRKAVHAAWEYPGPVYLRLSRMPVPAIQPDNYTLRIGRATILRNGTDVTLIANGIMVSRALDAAARLAEQGVEARVINMPSLKPLDEYAIIDAASETGAIVTIEEHNVLGGLGSAVAEVVVRTCPVLMRIMGIPDQFAPIGTAQQILDSFSLNAEGIAGVARELIEAKGNLQ